jgi:hypothetical protein
VFETGIRDPGPAPGISEVEIFQLGQLPKVTQALVGQLAALAVVAQFQIPEVRQEPAQTRAANENRTL